MKKLLLYAIFFCLISLQLSYAQNISFVSDKNFWSYCDVMIKNNDYDINYRQFYFKGDTIIENLIYKKLYSNVCLNNKTIYVAAMRESDKKVYAVYDESGEEKLIYDFGLELNDEFTSSLMNDTYKVKMVDSVLVDGGKRKRITFELSHVWIEGIGSCDTNDMSAPLSSVPLYDLGTSFNYFKSNEKIVLKTQEFYFFDDECSNAHVDYTPFPTEKATWSVLHKVHFREFQNANYKKIDNYFVDGSDTIIDGRKYYKVFVELEKDGDSKIVYNGAYREENKKIFYIGVGFTSYNFSYGPWRTPMRKIDCMPTTPLYDGEILLYDFNVNVGDEIMWGYYSDEIKTVDSIKIDGKFRRRLTTLNGEEYIEGIGSTQGGLLGSLSRIPTCTPMVSDSWSFICFSENGKTLYKNPDFVDCNILIDKIPSEFAPVGTEWYYNEEQYITWGVGLPPPTYNYTLLKSVGNTIIQNKKFNHVKKIHSGKMCNLLPDGYFRSSTDTVYFYSPINKTETPLHIWNAQKGDEWEVHISDEAWQNIRVHVDSVAYVKLLDKYVRKQYLTYFSQINLIGYNVTVIEGIGDPDNLYSFTSELFAACDDFTVFLKGLRCFIHPLWGSYKTGETVCDYKTTAIEKTESNLFTISPNPTKDRLFITLSSGIFNKINVKILNGLGKIIDSKDFENTDNLTLSLENQPAGIYFIQIQMGDKTETNKIIKM